MDLKKCGLKSHALLTLKQMEEKLIFLLKILRRVNEYFIKHIVSFDFEA
jgi:hypothetical protein